MGNIKQKERINKESNNDDDIYCVPLMKSRTQQLEERRRQRDMRYLDDMKDIMIKRNYTVVKSEQYLPTSDMRTVSREELKKMHEYRNTKQRNYYTWH
jgi:hypothetical protein